MNSLRIAQCIFATQLALLAVGSLAQAGAPVANLTGIVYSESNNARIGHASVWLCDSGGNRLEESVTTDSGEFAFLGLHAGAYTLNVSAPGYEPAEIHVDVNFGTERGVSVFLKVAHTAVTEAPGGAVISAHELSMPKAARERVEAGKKKLYGEKKPERALKDFEWATAKASGYYEAYYQMGVAYLALQNPLEAEKSLQRSVDLSEQSFGEAVLALALLDLGKKDIVRGEPLLRRGLELNPSSWVGYYELGKLELYRDHYEAALKAANSAQEFGPNEPRVYRLLSLVHMRKKNYSAAISDLDEYVRLDPNSVDSAHAREIRADLQKRLDRATSAAAPTASPK